MDPRHDHLIPIPIQEFINGASTPVNLYIRLGADKFVLVAKAGSKTDRDRLQMYENKTVEYLWVRREDYPKLAKNNLAIAGIIVGQHNLDGKQKTQVLTQAAATVFRELDHVGMGFEAYSHSKQIVEATVALADSHRDLY